MKHMSNASCDEKKLKKVDLGAAEIADWLVPDDNHNNRVSDTWPMKSDGNGTLQLENP